MKTKEITVRVKAVEDPNDSAVGGFTAYASIFNNIDSYGDVVEPGAFLDSLAQWASDKADSNLVIPVYWSHLMSSDPDYNIGWVEEAHEDDHGLWVKAQLDIANNAKAAQVYRLIKGGRVSQMSFAYEVEEWAEGKLGDRNVTFLKKLKLHEVSVVQIGANQETEVLTVKAAADALLTGAKAGRAISSKNEDKLRAAQAALQEVLSSLDSDDEKTASAETKADEPAVTEENSSEDLSAASAKSASALRAATQRIRLLNLSS